MIMLNDDNRTKSTEPGALTGELTVMLLVIDDLLSEKGYVRGVELAERLEMSRPTVTRALQRIAALGYATYERYRGISLTPAGLEVAASARSRYEKAYGFLEATGVPIANIEHQARKIVIAANDDVLEGMEEARRRLV